MADSMDYATVTYVTKQSMTSIGILFPVLALLALTTRFYAWRHQPRKIAIDDILILPAAVLNITAGVAIIIGAQLNIIGGHSLPGVTQTEQIQLGKFEYAFWIGHVLAIGFIKLTILCFFRLLFRGRSTWTPFDYANWTLIGLVLAWTLVFFFFEILACGSHPAASWASVESLRQNCVDTFGLQTGGAAFNWLLDLAILIEPLLMIRTLNMKLRRKVQASLVFLGSGFAVAAGILRLIPWVQIKVQDVKHPTIKILATNLATADEEAIVSIVLFWTYIEIGTGFLVACLPRSAWVFDKIRIGSFFQRLRSISSVGSFSRLDPTPSRQKQGDKRPFQGEEPDKSMDMPDQYYDAGSPEAVSLKERV
ncbi:hypothetical protein F4824DRAFT_458542 [Ustulina deusta]|nr:hypothetical protein F4823DRAFT_591456 [Ustulina deusta]KAI3338692.1 hypothetical protein F4824DRAFT_458542 [Ustulina deusta]